MGALVSHYCTPRRDIENYIRSPCKVQTSCTKMARSPSHERSPSVSIRERRANGGGAGVGAEMRGDIRGGIAAGTGITEGEDIRRHPPSLHPTPKGGIVTSVRRSRVRWNGLQKLNV